MQVEASSLAEMEVLVPKSDGDGRGEIEVREEGRRCHYRES